MSGNQIRACSGVSGNTTGNDWTANGAGFRVGEDGVSQCGFVPAWTGSRYEPKMAWLASSGEPRECRGTEDGLKCEQDAALPDTLVNLRTARTSARSRRQNLFECNDFFSGTSVPWLGGAVAAGTISSGASGWASANHQGVVLARSLASTANTGYYWTTLVGGSVITPGLKFSAILQPSWGAGSPACALKARIGFFSGVATTDPAAGAWLELNNGTVTSRMTGPSLTGTPVAALTSGVWYRFQVAILSASSIGFDIFDDSGASVFSETWTGLGALPTSTAGCGVWGINTAATSTLQNLCGLDYVELMSTAELVR